MTQIITVCDCCGSARVYQTGYRNVNIPDYHTWYGDLTCNEIGCNSANFSEVEVPNDFNVHCDFYDWKGN